MSDDDCFYHVTTYDRLAGIAEHGLVPGSAAGIGGAAYDANRKGYVFLTECDDVFSWHSLAEQWSEYQSETPCEDDLVPMVLRVAIEADELEPDDVAQAELRWGSYKFKGEIEPEYLEVFDGEEFIPIEDYDSIDPMDACEWIDDDDFEEGGYYAFRQTSPFLPPE